LEEPAAAARLRFFLFLKLRTRTEAGVIDRAREMSLSDGDVFFLSFPFGPFLLVRPRQQCPAFDPAFYRKRTLHTQCHFFFVFLAVAIC
jgi:hypothetical protein